MMYRSRDCKAIVANRAARVPPWRVFLWSFPVLALLLMLAQALPSHAQGTAAAPSASRTGADQEPADYSLRFDAARDPAHDLRRALAAAAASDKRVLVMVGGDWCVWCFLLDRHLRSDAEAAHTLYGEFELLRVYYGDDNTNEAFLAAFPEFELFPHFFVVETDGHVLASVDADVLIADAKYDTGLIRKFAAAWHRH